ncbi:unnamed protein product [Caenorhabditis angaria]|uniref:C-type lectin domain-containing protein n=1 Tax=Caenorhabditis angaria TaxID=860376 RepID=A0A9P1J066_9PELO|nr:unnamed protein product [Caenorhabditis angaria]
MRSTLLSLLLLNLSAFCYASCPSGMTAHDSKCYAYLGMDFSRNNSLSVCQATYGPYARLAKPTSKIENDFLTRMVQTNAVWYTWLDYISNGVYFVDENGQTPKYTDFAIGEPFSVASGYCLTLGMSGFWYAQPCTENHSALCELDYYITTKKTTPTPKVTSTTAPQQGYPSCMYKYLNTVPCPSGWDYYPATCSCFKVISNMTYYNSLNYCRALGGYLASVHTSGEAAFIRGVAMKQSDYWIYTATGRDNIIVGLNYNYDNRTLQWDDSTPFDYPQGFAPGEPSSLTLQGQIILTNPMGYTTYMRMFDCSSQSCRYAACKKTVY